MASFCGYFQLKYEGSYIGTIPHYDLLGDVVENLKPVILHPGGRILSKRLKDIIEQQSNTPYIHVQNTLERQDEFHRASNRFTGIVAFAKLLEVVEFPRDESPSEEPPCGITSDGCSTV